MWLFMGVSQPSWFVTKQAKQKWGAGSEGSSGAARDEGPKDTQQPLDALQIRRGHALRVGHWPLGNDRATSSLSQALQA